MPETSQMKAWSGSFGEDYTRRNQRDIEELESLYVANYGVGRRKMNEEFLGRLDRKLRILEVGSNLGNQLLMLRTMGFRDLFGIDIQLYALKRSMEANSNLALAQAEAFRLPFQDKAFDLVFTSGVLIHIQPTDLPPVIKEIHRCSRRYIWGFEYHADSWQQVTYRSRSELLWKGDFSSLYRSLFPDLSLEAEVRYPYTKEPNTDSMFLLKK